MMTYAGSVRPECGIAEPLSTARSAPCRGRKSQNETQDCFCAAA